MIVIAQYPAKEGSGDAVAEVLARHAVSSLGEVGCLQFEVLRSLDSPNEFILLEEYADAEAFQAHRKSSHFLANIEGNVAKLLAARVWQRYRSVTTT